MEMIVIVVFLLINVAYLTLIERKVMAFMQGRKGPDVVGIFGMFQPFADALKLIVKESIIPNLANFFIFLGAPFITFILSFLGWVVMPFNKFLVISDLNIGILYLFAISSLGVYGIIMAGWSSNSKYSFLGALRSAAQMVSYEVSIGLIVMLVIIYSRSLNITSIVLSQENNWYFINLFPIFIMFFISILAETNRAPFDLPEAEAELVSGYNVEYSAIGFVFFFFAEYLNILLMSTLCVFLFFGGWFPFYLFNFFSLNIWLGFKVSLILFLFIWTRASLPRYRYDQLMFLGWKVFLPLIISFFIFIICYFILLF